MKKLYISRYLSLAAGLLIISFITGGCYFNHFTQETLDGMEAMQEYKPKEETQQMLPEKKEPKKGGELTLSMHHPTTLNPLLNTDISVGQILNLLFQPLFYVDQTGRVLPNIVESFFYSADGKSLTLTLKNNIQFHDGKYMSVDDIIYSLKTLQSPDNISIYKHCVQNIQSFSKVDSLAMNIIFTRTSSLSSYDLIFPIIPEHYYDTLPLTNSNNEPKDMSPIGSGSYKYESLSKSEMMLTTAQRYHDKPYISQIKVSFIDDKLSEMYSFDGGLIELADTQIMDWGRFSAKHASKIVTYTTRNYDFIGFNMASETFSNIFARKAVAHIIQKDKIVDQIYKGHALATTSIISPDSYLYASSLQDYNYEEKLAKNFFKVAGWNKVNEEGMLYKTITEKNKSTDITLTFNILVNAENEERNQIALMLQKSLAGIGVDAQITVLPYAEYIEKLTAKEFDLFIGGWSLSSNPDCSFAFHSSNIENGKNYVSYSNPKLDELTDKAHLAFNETDIIEAFYEIQSCLLEDLPYISIAFRQSSIFLNENIAGTPTPLVNNIFFGMDDWFIDY